MPELTVIPYFDTPPEHCSSCFYIEDGKCRRYPSPLPVRATDWCGEHATLNDADEVVRTFA